MKIVAIVNPVAGRKRAACDWPRLLEAAGAAAARVTTWWSESPDQAEALAAQACREGFDRVIAVGGDGTLFQVANGLWWEGLEPCPSLAAVPFGTGCDYVRNFALGAGPAENLQVALGEATVPIDVGSCDLSGLDGKPRRRIFVNHLGLGFDARVVHRFQHRADFLKGKAAYAICVLQELLHLQSHLVQGEVDGRSLAARVQILVAGLGRYFGGGIMVAPQASPYAGRFQVVWLQPVSRLQVLGLFPDLWTGRHLQHHEIQSQFAERVRLASDPPAWVEAEGELIGQTPIAVALQRQALNFAARGFSEVASATSERPQPRPKND